MSDTVTRLLGAIDIRDADAIAACYEPDARLVTMTPNTFLVAEGRDAVVARLGEWYLSWEEDPHLSFLGTIRDGDRAFFEFERTSTFEGEPWVVRQAHALHIVDGAIRDHRIYCCGPRQGDPDLTAVYAGSAS
jgi:hypothetical protein